MKNKIELIMLEEDELRLQMRNIIHTFFRDECGKRLDNPLKELEAYLHKIQIFIREWEIYNRIEKAKLLKNDTVTEFKTNANELNEVIKHAVDMYKGKSKILENNLVDLLKGIGYDDRISIIDAEVDKLSSKLKETKIKIEKIKFEDLLVEAKKEEVVEIKPEPVKEVKVKSDLPVQSEVNPQVFINPQQPIQQPVQAPIQQPIHQPVQVPIQFPKQGFQNIPPQQFNNQIPPQPFFKQDSSGYPVFQNFNQNNMEFNLLKDVPLIDVNPKPLIFNPVELKPSNPYFAENTNSYDLFITIKPKSDNIIIYNGKTTEFVTVQIKPEHFQEKSTAFTNFPENCRYVNIHSSLMVTGGYVNRQVSKQAYLIVPYAKNDGQYEVNIINYANMTSTRERHNIINLFDRKEILTCSGFFNNTAEITNLDHGTWKPLPNMNTVRANATIAYVNKKNVFVFGGFRINEKQVGEYQNSCEVLNLDDTKTGWKLIKMDSHKLHMRVSAMGVINISPNSLLLCGGFDGSTYKSEVYRVDLKDTEIINYDRTNMVLPGNLIFIHNNFVRMGDVAFNYDLQNNLFAFNPETNTFKMHLMLNK